MTVARPEVIWIGYYLRRSVMLIEGAEYSSQFFCVRLFFPFPLPLFPLSPPPPPPEKPDTQASNLLMSGCVFVATDPSLHHSFKLYYESIQLRWRWTSLTSGLAFVLRLYGRNQPAMSWSCDRFCAFVQPNSHAHTQSGKRPG